MRNLNIIARNSVDGFYYPGFVMKSVGEASQSVRFYSLVPQVVPHEHIIPIGGAVAWPELMVGDHALVGIRCKSTKVECYLPGIVMVLPRFKRYQTKFFTIRLYTGKCVEKQRILIVKIAKEKFQEIIDYINEVRYGKPIRFLSDPNLYDSSSKLLQRDRLPSQILPNWHNKKDVTIITRLSREKSELIRELQRVRTKHTSCRQKRSRHRYLRESRLTPHLSMGDITKVNMVQKQEPFATSSLRSSRSSASSLSRSNVRQQSKRSVDSDVQTDLSDVSSAKEELTPSNKANTESDRVSDKKDTAVYADDTFEDLEDSFASSARDHTDRSHRSHRSQISISSSEESEKIVKKKPAISRPASDSNSNKKPRSVAKKPRDNHPDNRRNTIADGQEVLARWLDDGWYYFGVVVTEIEDQKYVVRDNTGHNDTIVREDMLLESEHSFNTIQPRDFVIALHPKYIFSYAPAVVKTVYNFGVRVEFFDTSEAKLTTSEVFRISEEKYRKDVNYIKECEKRVCHKGGSVVARDDNTGYYVRCKAECLVGSHQTYFITLPNGTYVKQTAVHIFDTKLAQTHRKERDWHFILALIDETFTKYLPAQIVQRQPFGFQFCDGRETNADTLEGCFYLSEDYYRLSVNYFINSQSMNYS